MLLISSDVGDEKLRGSYATKMLIFRKMMHYCRLNSYYTVKVNKSGRLPLKGTLDCVLFIISASAFHFYVCFETHKKRLKSLNRGVLCVEENLHCVEITVFSEPYIKLLAIFRKYKKNKIN